MIELITSSPSNPPPEAFRGAGPPPAAELAGVFKAFGSGDSAVQALSGVELTLEPGQVVALLGPNGAGKTTAVRLLLGLETPDRGFARVFGGAPGEAEARRRTGVVLQISGIPETLTVSEHLELFASYYPRPRPRSEVLAAAGLEGFAHRRFGDLSGGQQQRALFGLALVGDPDLLVLDEPTVGLDVESRRSLWAEIRRAVARGTAVLLTTHYLDEADALADRVVVLHQGRVLAEGTSGQIKARTAARRVRAVTSLSDRAVRDLLGDRIPENGLRRDGVRLELLTPTAEPVVAALLGADPDLSDLEVTSAGLEEAFLTLTAGDGDAPRSTQAVEGSPGGTP